ncbi:MAG: DUF4097 domain-containing protein, partial [Anaerolinea sp.]|nr:DUF4097 domain-containing protein [Anaerolinea sp.]
MTSRPMRILIAFLPGLLLLAAAACAPAISLVRTQFSVPLRARDEAPPTEHLTLELRSLLERIAIEALPPESERILYMEADHAFPLQVVDEGDVERTLRLIAQDAPSNFSYVGEPPVWAVSLHPAFPVELRVRSGAGALDLDLAQFTLTALRAETTGGAIRAVLPAVDAPYPVTVRSKSGSVTLTLVARSAVDLDAATETGDIQLDLATAAAASGTITSDSGAIAVTTAIQASGELRLRTESGDIVIDAVDSAPALRVEVRQIGTGSIAMPSFM